MNDRLLQLLRKAVKDPPTIALDGEISALCPTESDFEEILDIFASHERRVIYVGMSAWCARALSETFIRRRLAIEKDLMCRDLLESRMARMVGKRNEEKPCEEPVQYEERTPDFRRKLRALVLQHVKDPNNWNACQRISSLKPTDLDFDDELFDSLASPARLEVYTMLLLWCGYKFQKAILERRAIVETDVACRVAITAMLHSSQ